MPQDHAAEAWRDEFAAALEASPLSQADLARAIGRAQQQVSDWMAGRAKVPRPDVVFDIEDALDCPDRLAQTQGYVRAVPVDTEVTIRRDAALSAEDQRVLVRMYRALTGR
jgi:transcriptional regulator with XRE-family HTH domain